MPRKKDFIKKQEEHARENYDEKYKEEYHRGWENVSRAVREFIDKYRGEFSDDKRILDLGCGQGRNLLYIAEKGLDAYGIDISGVAVKQAQELLEKKGLRAHLAEGSFYNLPYKQESFRAVVSSASLHNIPPEGVRKAFQEISRVLKDGGLFLLNVKSTPPKRKNKKMGENFFYYDRDELKQLAEENSFEIEVIQEDVSQDENYEDNKKGFWTVVFRKKEKNNYETSQ